MGGGAGWAALPFALVTVLGVAGLRGWTRPAARLFPGAACTLLPLALSIHEASLVPALLQWYDAVAAVYPLVIAGRWAAAMSPLTGLCYVLQVAAGAAPVPYAVASPRASSWPTRPAPGAC